VFKAIARFIQSSRFIGVSRFGLPLRKGIFARTLGVRLLFLLLETFLFSIYAPSPRSSNRLIIFVDNKDPSL
jgi:hypothetical protein